MQIASALMRALFGAMFLSGFLIAMPAMATKLDDATCLSCHNSGKGKLEMPGAAGGVSAGTRRFAG